jgi:hypothetical protein
MNTPGRAISKERPDASTGAAMETASRQYQLSAILIIGKNLAKS